MLSILSYKKALVYYCAMVVVLFSGYLSCVVAPHRQNQEICKNSIGGTNSDRTHIENRKFSDFTSGYIPEINEHLTAKRSGWLALWSNSTELGRPLYHISGFSPAYLPSWVLSKLFDNPWWFITLLTLSHCFFAGLFILLFVREIGLSPIAGLIAGINLAASPLFMYWLTFPMFPAVWCWSAGVLWAVTRLAKCHDFLSWSVLAFSAYSLLMTAYPQPVVYHAYLIGGYGFWLACRQARVSRSSVLRFHTLVASALVIGGGLAFPVYRDLAIICSESARVSADPSFFTVVLPKIANFAQLVRFLVLSTVPELFGNPIRSDFPFPYDGLSVTLIVVFFTFFGLLTEFKRTWGWWLATALLCLLAFVHPLYVLGVKYLGFNLSRSSPLGSITLPITVISAFGIDALVKHTGPRKFVSVVSFSGLATLAFIALGVAYGISQDVPIRWGLVAGMLLVSGLLFAQYDKFRPLLLMLALASVMIMTSYPLMLKQDPAQIAMTSPLVEKVRENLPPGTRYAVAAPGVSALPPNLNATLGLASVHSYNSLSSTRYHTLINSLGGEIKVFGRHNKTISPTMSAMFWMSNISLILSPAKLGSGGFEYLGEESGIHLYKVVSLMGESLQVSLPQLDMDSTNLVIDDPRVLTSHTPIKILDEGDRLEFKVTDSLQPSVFLLSQKFHRDWQARVYTGEEWQAASTVEINGVFQGVLLPSAAQRVRLDFKPFTRYAWIAHVFWLCCLILICFKAWQRCRHNALEGQ